MAYVKLFQSILASSLWSESMPTRVVWITLLAMADRDGYVAGSVPGVAHMARVSREEAETAIAMLSAPDADSSSPENEGRRIVRVDGGWQITTYERYRDKRSVDDIRERARLRQERKRERDRHAVSRESQRVTAITPSYSGSDSSQSTPPSVRPSASTSVPVPLAVPAQAGGWVGGEPPVAMRPSPDPTRDRSLSFEDRLAAAPLGSPEESDLILESFGWGERMADRLGLCRELVAQGLGVHHLTELHRLAKQQGRDPAALGMRWLTSGAWVDLVVEQGVPVVRPDQRPPDDDDLGPIYGDAQPQKQKA